MPDTKPEKPSILYVDDEAVNLKSFNSLFRRDYKIHQAISAEQGLEILKQNNIQVIIADQRMPEITGAEFLEQVAAEFPETIRFMLTGFSDYEAIVYAINNSKIQGYFQKPLDEKEIKTAIDKALETYYLRVKTRQLIEELKNHRLHLEELVEERTAELKKLWQATVQSPASVIVTDLQGTIEYVNPRFSEITGYSSEEVIGKNPNILKSGKHSLAFYKEMWDIIKSGKEWRGEICNKKKNGEIFWEFTSISSIRNDKGDITHFITVKEDLTKRKKMEEALRTAKQEAEEANRAKSIFLANMSHELRTPLNSIIGFTGVLLMGIAGDLNEEQKKQLTMAKNSAHQLLNLLNDILDISKIEADEIDMLPEEFYINEVIQEVIETVIPWVNRKKIELQGEISEKIMIFSDKRHIKQILMNLVSNAVKFTDQGSVKIESEVLENGYLEMRVIDTGIGIKKEDISKLFEFFQQVDMSPTKKHEGAGLGLYLVKKLLSLLGGDISVRSEYGKGSEFAFTLPLKYKEKK